MDKSASDLKTGAPAHFARSGEAVVAISLFAGEGLLHNATDAKPGARFPLPIAQPASTAILREAGQGFQLVAGGAGVNRDGGHRGAFQKGFHCCRQRSWR